MTARTPMASNTFIHTPEERGESHRANATGGTQGNVVKLFLTNVVCFLGNESALQRDHFNGVQADLNDVVDEGQQRGERKRCYKYGGEAELDD